MAKQCGSGRVTRAGRQCADCMLFLGGMSRVHSRGFGPWVYRGVNERTVCAVVGKSNANELSALCFCLGCFSPSDLKLMRVPVLISLRAPFLTIQTTLILLHRYSSVWAGADKNLKLTNRKEKVYQQYGEKVNV